MECEDHRSQNKREGLFWGVTAFSEHFLGSKAPSVPSMDWLQRGLYRFLSVLVPLYSHSEKHVMEMIQVEL
jgi:hypothetical protein